MSTLRLVTLLAATASLVTFMLFFIPWSLNAHNSIINLIGVAFIVGCWIAVIAVFHRSITRGSWTK